VGNAVQEGTISINMQHYLAFLISLFVYNTADIVRINVTLRRVRATVVAVEKQ